MLPITVKIGNLKLGKIDSKKNSPVALEKILVTRATKESGDNFKVYPGFEEDGESSILVTLPFNKPENNFEVNYVTFLKVDDIEYIAKAESIGADVILYPLNAEDFDTGPKLLGKLNDELIESLKFKYAGLLKVMIPDVSSFGEVFYFKTQSINTIKAIQSQLLVASQLLHGKLANYPFDLKAIKKDVDKNKSITFLSIGLNMHELRNYKEEDEYLDETLNFSGLDELVEKNRASINELDEISKDAKIIVIANNFEETVVIKKDRESLVEELIEIGVPEDMIDIVLEKSTRNNFNVVKNYFISLKENNRKYVSVFKKALTDGVKPYQMLKEIEAYKNEQK